MAIKITCTDIVCESTCFPTFFKKTIKNTPITRGNYPFQASFRNLSAHFPTQTNHPS